MSLADYVDDELVRVMREYRKAMSELDVAAGSGQEKTGTAAWGRVAEMSSLVAGIAKAMADEAETLRTEFQQFATHTRRPRRRSLPDVSYPEQRTRGASHMSPAPTMLPVQLRSRTDVEAEITRRLAAERARLEREAGIQSRSVHHFQRPVELPFTADQRDRVTILFGGLTWKHEVLVHAALAVAGYKVEVVPTPDVPAFQLGKEYGNNGQCNPTYFTVGNLVQYLQNLEATGHVTRRRSSTATSSSPPAPAGRAASACTRRSTGWRCATPASTASASCCSSRPAASKPGVGEAGLEVEPRLLHGHAQRAQLRRRAQRSRRTRFAPSRSNAGETDRVARRVRWTYLHDGFATARSTSSRKLARSCHRQLPGAKPGRGTAEHARQVRRPADGRRLRRARSQRARERLDAIEVDRLRVKPIVKITGEFWAQTTEGDGNFNMFSFLEREGAQVLVEPIGTWIMYMLHQAAQKATRSPRASKKAPCCRRHVRSCARAREIELSYRQKVAELQLRREPSSTREYRPHRATRSAASRTTLADQYELQRLGASLLQLARRRRRRPPGSRQEHLLLATRTGAHGAVAEAVRLHAVNAVRRRAVGRDEPLQGHDLPADRDLRRGRDQRPQPRADGARRSQGQGQDANSQQRLEADRQARSTRSAPSSTTHPELQQPALPGARIVKGVVGTAAQLRAARRASAWTAREATDSAAEARRRRGRNRRQRHAAAYGMECTGREQPVPRSGSTSARPR